MLRFQLVIEHARLRVYIVNKVARITANLRQIKSDDLDAMLNIAYESVSERERARLKRLAAGELGDDHKVMDTAATAAATE